MNSSQDLDIEYRDNLSKKLLVYDLALDQQMYCVPKKILDKIKTDYPVKLEAINCPNLEISNKNAEIYWGNRINNTILEMMPNLKWVHFGSVGINRLNNMKRKDLLITSSKGLVTDSMITHVITLIGIYSRRLDIFFVEANKPLFRNDFDKYFSEIKNFNELKILIIGLGNIGTKLAEKLFLMGSKVDGVSRIKKKTKFVENQYTFNQCENHLNKYDFVISLLPENKDTLNKIDYKFLRKMNPNSILINLGRGSTINERDLVLALDNEIIGRAILDVTEKEPLPPESILHKHSKIFLTPHIASFSPSYWPLQEKLFRHNLEYYLKEKFQKMINLESNFTK